MTPMQTDRARLRKVLDVGASVATLLTCGVLVWFSFADRGIRAAHPSLTIPKDPIALSSTHVQGRKTAKIAMIEYADFQCPYCGTFARDILPPLEQEYVATGKMLFEFRHLPLAMHAQALKAAQASECAAAQGRFWEMHERLFASPSALDEKSLTAKSEQVGLSAPTFSTCMSDLPSPRIRENQATAAAYGITGTPAFFLGDVTSTGAVSVRQALTGPRPVAEFRKAIDALLSGKLYVNRR